MYAKSATTIANILEAAQTLFIARNFADVTMSDIAEAADVTKGALYHHFSGKEELYLKMMHSFLAETKAYLETAVASEGTCRDRLRRFSLRFLQMPPQQQALMRLVRRDINIFKDPEREQLVRAYQAAVPQQAETIIRDGIDSGEIAAVDARLLAWEHVAIVEIVLSEYARTVFSNAGETADFVTRLFFDGVAAS